MSFDLDSFYQGNCFDAQSFFGAHLQEGGCVFRTFAPDAYKVDVIGAFSDWKPVSMDNNEGVWSVTISDAKAGQAYKYRIYSDQDHFVDHIDPYGFGTVKHPDTGSVIEDLDFTWTDQQWMQNRTLGLDKPVNIYEIHLESWKHKENGDLYTYAELAPILADYLKKHGYTHAEFLPITEYPSDQSWGYQVLGFYSPTSRLGTPKQLMEMINYLHDQGIGVIMDFVPVHFALDAYGLALYDGKPLFEYEDENNANSQWGSKNFAYDRGDVRSFLQSAMNFWVDTYHMDGLRLDAVSHAIFWQGDESRGVNDNALDFLKEVNSELAERHPDVMKIAEDSGSYGGVTTPVDQGGLGFNYKWDIGWTYDTVAFFRMQDQDKGQNLQKLCFSFQYFGNEHYIIPFSHDEISHGKQSVIYKMNGNPDEQMKQLRLLYLYMIAHPGKKMNFMGNEFAVLDEWDEEKQLDWNLLDQSYHSDFLEYMTDLNNIYLQNPALYATDYQTPEPLQFLNVNQDGVLAYLREGDGQTVLTILNFKEEDVNDLRIYLPEASSYQGLCTTGSGLDISQLDTAENQDDSSQGQYYLSVNMPGFSGALLKRC